MIALLAACAANRPIDAHVVGPEPGSPGGDSDPPEVVLDSGTPPVDSGTSSSTEPQGPRIVDLTVVPLDTTLEVHVAGRQGTASLDGGSLVVELDGGAPIELGLPADVEMVGDEVVFALDRPKVGECAPAADHVVAVELFDRAGWSSGSVEAAVFAPAHGIVVPEVGEEDAAPIGVIARGTLVCGTLELVSNNGFDYTGDVDWTELEFSATGSWDVELRWTELGDWDVELWKYSGGTWTEVAESTGPDIHGPEAFSVYVYRDTTYQVMAAGWSGDPGDWTIELD